MIQRRIACRRDRIPAATELPLPSEGGLQLHIPADRVAEVKRRLFDLHVTHPDGSITVVQARNSAGGAKSGARSSKKTFAARVAKAPAKKN